LSKRNPKSKEARRKAPEKESHFTPRPRSHQTRHLASPRLDLRGSTLRTLLRYLGCVSTGGGSRRLGLLRLLLALGGGPLLLALLDGLVTSSLAGFGTESTLLFDHIEGGTNDGTLGLDGTAGSLLGDFLRDTLLVLATVENCPRDPSGVLALEEEGLGLAGAEAKDLRVTTDINLSLGGVDLATWSKCIRQVCRETIEGAVTNR